MRIRTLNGRLASALLLLFVATVAWVTPVQADVTYSGRAYAAFLNLPTLGVGPRYVSDTGELPPAGGIQSAELAGIELPGVLTVRLLVASTSGDNGVASSSASLADASLLPGHPAAVTASFLRAESEATCNRVRGSTEAADVTFGGQRITVDPFAPNQRFEIPDPLGGPPLATLVINEQTSTSGGGARSIGVNAVHLTLKTGDEVILSSAHSDINGCPGCPPPPICSDFATGGGWIAPGGGRANFGFNAGYKSGASTPSVQFNYLDHDTGMHMKAIDITEYAEGSTRTSRRFQGRAEINGVPGFTYKIEVTDNGEPGRHADALRIELSSGYSAGGRLEGGNIQLHRPCP